MASFFNAGLIKRNKVWVSQNELNTAPRYDSSHKISPFITRTLYKFLNYKTMAVYDKLLIDFKTLYWEYVPLSVIFQSCLGSVAAMMILAIKGPFYLVQLGLCILVSMFYNATILAQLKTKLVFDMLLISVGINLILLVMNIWMV